ncbi:MAG: non-canonical purine NTP pyrophosphatase [Candidatus Binatia bacterium]
MTEVSRLLASPVARVALSLEEIQAVALEPVVAHKVRQAYAQLQRPVLVEDTGLTFTAWNGLPGALIKWFLTSLRTDGLCRLLQNDNDRRATATTVFGYYDGTVYQSFTGSVEGWIPEHPRGTQGFGWDPIFQPVGSALTFAEMTPEEKDRFSMRRRALAQLRTSGLLDQR